MEVRVINCEDKRLVKAVVYLVCYVVDVIAVIVPESDLDFRHYRAMSKNGLCIAGRVVMSGDMRAWLPCGSRRMPQCRRRGGVRLLPMLR